eukprot:TRINITY_DN18508_c0_g1_i2.p3 TRINITY_DN18508_c0_g1~~TRINITY_DN18508_c0_g1_i2.p3  ORF type:complete len:212 (+),score=60.93 TRINITY_DN18508_c0_g1_i2:56-637(+)
MPAPPAAGSSHPPGPCHDEACGRCFEQCVLCPARVRKGDNSHLLEHLATQRRRSQRRGRQCSCCQDLMCTCLADGAKPEDLRNAHFQGVPSPVTVVTGYLGSGKSTLVDAICGAASEGRQPQRAGYSAEADRGRGSLRVAVLVNEYADTAGLERAAGLNAAAHFPRDEWIELGGGGSGPLAEGLCAARGHWRG